MNKNQRLLLIAIVSSLSCFSQAQAAQPDKGEVKYQQTCGKSIAISVTDLKGSEEGHTLLGLQNKSTMATDYFLSEKPTTALRAYEQYNKVFFDSLSQRYLPTEDQLNIVWGAAMENGKTIESYSLALGSHVYSCGKLEKIPDETTDRLYGEQ